MSDGIAKGVGEQLGSLVKQVATDVIKVPSQIIGFKDTKVNETKGDGIGSAQTQSGQKTKTQSSNIQDNAKQDEIYKQQELSKARRLLQEIGQPQQPKELSIHEQLAQEEIQKQQQLIKQQQKQATQQLNMPQGRPKQNSILAQANPEKNKNIKAQ